MTIHTPENIIKHFFPPFIQLLKDKKAEYEAKGLVPTLELLIEDLDEQTRNQTTE